MNQTRDFPRVSENRQNNKGDFIGPFFVCTVTVTNKKDAEFLFFKPTEMRNGNARISPFCKKQRRRMA